MRSKTIYSLVIAAVLTVTGGHSLAADPLQSKAYQCQELRQLVADNERVLLQGFLGSKSSVYSSPKSCDYLHEVAIKSAWKTKDVRSCVVGYRCLSRYNLKGKFGDSD